MSFGLIGADGRRFDSAVKGTVGGHLKSKIYGRLDCPSALRAVAKGTYQKSRIFFANEATARAAGYRPCAVCMRAEFGVWKQG